MKIIDCFMFYDEELLLDIRMNILNDFVDHFVIVESKYFHNGKERQLKFNINNYSKFKDKIVYIIHDQKPKALWTIDKDDDKNTISHKKIVNAHLRENHQRNFIEKGLVKSLDEDLILISDVDEIPKLSSINLDYIKDEIILFKQDMFYYKYNLALPNFKWTGTKAVKKKRLISPQWLRNVKDRKYPYYRIDTFFSDKKYMNIRIIDDGGWHFSNIKSPEMIEHKLRSYLHHREFDQVSLTVEEINELVKKKQAIYDLRVDKRVNKVGNGVILENFEIKNLPNYINENLEKYKKWLD